ncbi:MAG: hypothetical protein IV085_12255 [Thiobacillus sp.]|nr:hypothetical protein [Thiobacillus sp.]
MADPRNELADIVVPLAPAATDTAANAAMGWLVAGLVAIVVLAMLAGWGWHRRRFVRSLEGICGAIARQQGRPDTLAGLLDVWARGRFDLIRLDARVCPTSVAAEEWADWVDAVSAARFASPSSDAWDALSHLCKSARQWNRHG